ncbi:MAG: hypothetical protein GC168_00490 [Candidatus Hydrogenedens sp.]|nr:hypothetical protein [Candidatus Hydrogenedens sp.]
MELDAVIRNGRLDLEGPLPFPDGVAVHVVIIEQSLHVAESSAKREPRDVAKRLAEIAALPSTNVDNLREEDIDKILYGGDGT